MRFISLLLSLMALFGSHFPAVGYVLHRATPQTQEPQAKSPDRALLDAVESGQTDAVKSLLAAGADSNARDGANPASERFALELQAMARRFEQRLLQTRDFAPLMEEFFANRFLDCHVQTLLDRKENGIFMQTGGVTSLPPEVTEQIPRDELRSYLLVVLNFFHLRTLYRISRHEWGTAQVSAIEEFPPAAVELLKRNPDATRTSQTVEELRSRVLILEQAIGLMREYLVTHPPEEREAYRKNLLRIGYPTYNSKLWEIELFKLPEKERKGASDCLGMRVEEFAVIKVPPFYRLFLVRDKGGFKIGTMLCTEPPCAD